jgi:hypothetical protein
VKGWGFTGAGRLTTIPTIHDDRRMTWYQAQSWTDDLNENHHPGYNDWRPPVVVQPDPDCSYSSSDGMDFGFSCTITELACMYLVGSDHLFYESSTGTTTD